MAKEETTIADIPLITESPSNPRILIILSRVLPLVFFLVLSFYNVLLYNANNYAVFDLGLSYRTSLIFLQTHNFVVWTPSTLVSGSPFTKLIYVPLSLTLLIYNSPITMLIDQIAVISAGGYAIFRIANRFLGDYKSALLIQVVYFLYPPTYGFMAHGGNFMVYFEGLFLLGYMFYSEGKYLRAIPLILLAGITNFTAPLLLALFYLLDLGVKRWHKSFSMRNPDTADKNNSQISSIHSNFPFVLFVLIFSALLAVMEISIYSFSGALASTRVTTGGAVAGAAGSNLVLTGIDRLFSNFFSFKFTYFFELLAPLLFIPLLSVFSLPVWIFIAAAWYSNYNPYYNVIQQYPYLIAGIMFLAIIFYLRKFRIKKRMRRVLTIMLVATVAYFLVLSNFSITNAISGDLTRAVSITPYESELSHAYGLIPANSSVFIQLGPSDSFMNHNVIYAPGYYNNQTVDFAIINPNTYNLLTEEYGNIYFDYYWANSFAHNSSYGVYESVAGSTIYKLGYSGNPIYYIPAYYNSSYSINQTGPGGQWNISGNGAGKTIMAPGHYIFNFTLDLNVSRLDSGGSNLTVRVSTTTGIETVMANSSILKDGQNMLNLSADLTLDNFTIEPFTISVSSERAFFNSSLTDSMLVQTSA